MTSGDGGRVAIEVADARSRAGALLAGKEFAAAREAYEALLAEHQDGEVLEGLAAAHRGIDDVTGAVAVYERAYRAHLDAATPVAAAQVACTLADIELSDLGASAVAAGWLARARHHFEAHPDHPGVVALEALSAYRAMAYEKDPAAARAFASRAVAQAQRVGDAAVEQMGRAFLGLIQVSLGELEPGFALIDEATAAALAGELPPLADLDVYCVLITACDRVRDLDRMDQWAHRVLALATGTGTEAFATFARTQYASLLIGRGRWAEAEAELDRVLRDASGRPLTAAMAMALRASLRRRQGRLDEALAELGRCEREPYRRAVRHLVLATRAQVELDRGHVQEAADLAERYLRAVSASDVIERIDMLELLVRARVSLGDVGAAEARAGELESIASTISTDAVRAAASAARGTVCRAKGDLEEARAGLETAVDLLDRAGFVHEAVLVRLDLAKVLVEVGHLAEARDTAETARRTAAELGATREETTATALCRGIRGDASPDPAGMTRREAEILELVAEGMTNAEIAVRLVLSPRTVERHLSNIYLKVGTTGPAARTAAVAHARRSGLAR